MKVAAKDLREGMYVDLETCDYAYPGSGECADVFDYEYAVVEEIDTLIVIHTSLGSYGMPPSYMMDVADETREDVMTHG